MAVWAWAAVAWAGWAVEVDHASKGPAADRVVVDDAPVVLLVSGEQRGRTGPCGCDVRPLGGLDRHRRYVDAVTATGSPTLVLNAGGWLNAAGDGARVGALAREENERFWADLRGAGVDVLNVGWTELAALEGRGRPGLVATNTRTRQPVLEAVVRQVGQARVQVLGLTRAAHPYLWDGEASVVEPLGAVERAIAADDADLRVVLVYDAPDVAQAVARLPEVDVVVEAARYTARWPPAVEGALRVRTWDDGARLTELRLWPAQRRAVVREIDLDATLWAKSRRAARAAPAEPRR